MKGRRRQRGEDRRESDRKKREERDLLYERQMSEERGGGRVEGWLCGRKKIGEGKKERDCK